MRIVTIDDFCDIYFKAKQKGLGFIFSKFNINKKMLLKIRLIIPTFMPQNGTLFLTLLSVGIS